MGKGEQKEVKGEENIVGILKRKRGKRREMEERRREEGKRVTKRIGDERRAQEKGEKGRIDE